MAGAGISYKKEYLSINCTCPASICGIFHTLYEPKFQVALTHRNWTGGLLPVNASSYILGASIQPLAWLCVGCVRVSNEGLWMRLRLGNTTSCCGTQ